MLERGSVLLRKYNWNAIAARECEIIGAAVPEEARDSSQDDENELRKQASGVA
jgi:hypothetical protein